MPLALCMLSTGATASTLFSDLGPLGDAYTTNPFTLVGGNGPGDVFTYADLFTVAGSGSLPVYQIDLAVSDFFVPETFYASIWTDNAGVPEAELSDAYWSLSTSTPPFTCCSLLSVTGITGVNLTGGQQYFMVLGPLSLSNPGTVPWYTNNQGVTGAIFYSLDGGSSWTGGDFGNPLSAFDVLGVPEPSSRLLMGAGLIGMLMLTRRKHRDQRSQLQLGG